MTETIVPEVTDERCPECGFEWDAFTTDEIVVGLRNAGAAWADLLDDPPATVAERLVPGEWSIVEYGAHVRDIGYNLRDRIVVGLAEDAPVPHRMFPDLRADLGLYAGDDAERLATEVPNALDLLGRTLTALDADALERPIRYGWPRDTWRTLRWVGSQALHEAQHHLADARRQI